MSEEKRQLSTRESWELIAPTYQESVAISLNDVHYGPYCQGEKQLRLLGDISGKNVVEIGCGGGHNSIVLAKWGAKVLGVDFSGKQIAHAEKLAAAEDSNAQFLWNNIEDLSNISALSADLVLSVFAIEYVKNLKGLCLEVARILKPGGVFVFSDLHPFVSGGNVLNISESSFWAELNYFQRRGIEFEWEFSSEVKGFLVRYHRTIEDNIRALKAAGLILEDIREPAFQDAGLSKHPYMDETLLEDSSYWHRIPYTMIFKARKPFSVIEQRTS